LIIVRKELEMSENVILFSTGCPRCKVLEKKLKENSVKYTVVNDIDKMIGLGIQSVPVILVGEKMYGFEDAMEFVNSVKPEEV
jgi:glutaredoxin